MKSIVYFFAGAMFITALLSACATDPKAEQEIIANLNTQISNGQASMDRFASSKQNLGMIMQMFQKMPEESKAKYPTEVAETQKKLDALIAYFRSISLPQDSLLKEAYTLQADYTNGQIKASDIKGKLKAYEASFEDMANVNAEMDNKLGEIQVLMAAMGFQTDLATGGRGDAAGAATGGDAAGAAGGDAAGAAGGDAAGATGGDAAGTPSTNGGGAAGADGMQNKDVTPAAKQVPADGKSQFVNPNGKKKPGQ